MVRLPTVAAVLVLGWLAASTASARVTDEQIEAAIDHGVQYLLTSQNDKGWWSANAQTSIWTSGIPGCGGNEAYAMLALAYAGVSLNDPKMQKGLDALLELKLYHTYIVPARIMTISKLLHKLDRERRDRAMEVLKADTMMLLSTQRKNGGWGYPQYTKDTDPPKVDPRDDWTDSSNTQIAVLGLSEAINAGLELPPDAVKRVQDYYLRIQLADGGWGYDHLIRGQEYYQNAHGSLTAAGVASLFITRDYLYRGLGCPCKGDRSSARTSQVDKAIDDGLAWLGKHFMASKHPVVPDDPRLSSQWILYWLYSCERAGLASGIKYFGGHDWYAEGAEHLVNSQRRTGDWGPMYDTSYALCFLVKGRAPVLFNKLQFKGVWCAHPRDIANLAGYVSKQKEQPIQWQVITLEAPVDEWHDAPILYISAESALALSDDEKKKLRQFTDSGGTVFFEASCGNREASNSWRALAKEVWPEWEMKVLGKDHPLFVADQKMTAGRLPTLSGMDDGLRTFALVSFADISCAWNTQAVTTQSHLFNLGSNLYVYATDHRALRARLAEKKTLTRKNYLDATLQAGPRARLKVARVKHGGDWYVGRNYDPLGRLAAALAGRPVEAGPAAAPPAAPPAEPLDPSRIILPPARATGLAPTAPAVPAIAGGGLRLDQAEPVDSSGLVAAAVQIAHLTGRQGVTLGDAEAAALKSYLQGGGFLVAEAAMGDARFDADFQALARQLGLESKLLAADDPLMTGKLIAAAGYDVSNVRYRYALRAERIGNPLPLLYGLRLGGKLVGIYSPFDLSFSQTGFDAWACRGYEAEDALALWINLLLYVSTK